jgi:hypothetical protein
MYRFDVADRTGIFLGLGVLQLGILAVAAVSATVMVSVGVPLVPVITLVVAAVVVAAGSVGGVRIVDWLPVAGGWVWNRRGRRWRARLHPLTAEQWSARHPELPDMLAGIRFGEAGASWGQLGASGVVHDQRGRTMSAVMRVHARGFALAPRDEQVRLLAGWGDVIAAFATERGAVSRLAWSDFAAPAGVGEHLRWLEDQSLPTSSAAERCYRGLLDTFATDTPNHDLTLTVTVAAHRLTRGQRGADAETRLLTALAKAVESVARAGRSTGISVGDPLTPIELAAVLRTRLDPDAIRRRSRHEQRKRGPLARRLGLVDPADCGPLSVDTTWRAFRADGSCHRAYWISEWPRLLQHPDWMEPILGFTGGRSRAITGLVASPQHVGLGHALRIPAHPSQDEPRPAASGRTHGGCERAA